MIFYLLKHINSQLHFPGIGLIDYISFRAAISAVFSLFISIFWGKAFITYLKKINAKDKVRDKNIKQDIKKKEQTPSMGGLIIALSTLLPTLLFAKVKNIYVILLVFTTIWMSFIGFCDDYIKIFKGKKGGISGWIKIVGQFVLGIVVSITLLFHKDVIIRERITANDSINNEVTIKQLKDIKSRKTNVPFFKGNELDYDKLFKSIFPFLGKYIWVIYVLFITFIITSVSNGANLTDGLDGLAAGTSSVIALTLAILAYLSGNVNFANYLNILQQPSKP